MVDYGMNRVQAESVYVEVCHPVQRVLYKKATDFVAFRTVEVESRTPGCAIPVSKIGAELREIIAFRAKMIVDHIKCDGDALLVTGADQGLQGRRSAVGILYGERKDTIVAPIPISRKLRYRHQLNGCNSQ